MERYSWPKTILGWENLVGGVNVLSGEEATMFVNMVFDVVDSRRVAIESRNLGLQGELVMESNRVGQIIFKIKSGVEICGRFLVLNKGEELGSSVVTSFCDAMDIGFYIEEGNLVERANKILPVLRNLSEKGLKVIVDRGLMALFNLDEKGLDLVRRR